MHILHQLRFLVLLVLHCSPGEDGDPCYHLSSLISVTGWTLYCSQCSTAESPDCRRHPPSPSLCPPDTSYCLILEEYKPNLIGECRLGICSEVLTLHIPDDADANLGDDGAGSLLFMARTCVGENVGDFCSTGVKEGQAVTVCRSGSGSHGRNINDNK